MAAVWLALTGGVGGAKLALGLSRVLAPAEVAFIVNTGDDFVHLGLHVSPDIDTLVYTLAGESNHETGWGRRDETWQFMAALRELGGETWFNLGDRDLAMHVERTRRLAGGARLTQVTRELATGLGVRHAVLPMTDEALRTVVRTGQGELAFQHYFVRERCAPAVTGFRFDGARAARVTPEVTALLDHPDLAGVIVCPSNPFVSIDPILAVSGMKERLLALRAPVIAVSPIVRGAALKGPTAKMMRELAVPTTATEVAAHYGDLLDGFVIDAADAHLERELTARGIAVRATQTVMTTLEDRVNLARACIEFLSRLETR